MTGRDVDNTCSKPSVSHFLFYSSTILEILIQSSVGEVRFYIPAVSPITVSSVFGNIHSICTTVLCKKLFSITLNIQPA